MRAETDLAAIARYTIENYGSEQADRYREGLLAVCDFLAANPRAARERIEIAPPVRVHPHKKHLMYTIVDDDEILIVRVTHGREDWASRLD